MYTGLVSRQAVIEHLSKRLYETALNNVDKSEVYTDIAENRLTGWVDELPSIQPKEKTGKWTIIREVLIPPSWRAELKFECKCSECGYVQVIPFGTKFCYHCGQALDWSDDDE